MRYATPRAVRELARGLRRPSDDRTDLLERHAEEIVQDEREPLRRCQRIEHHEQCHADRLREHGLLLGVRRGRTVVVPAPGLDGACVQRVLATRLSRAQHVEAHACDDRREPAGEVVDAGRIGALEAQPRLLHRVLGFAQRSEHAVRDAAQPRPVLLELFGQPAVLRHSRFSFAFPVTFPRFATSCG